MPALHPHETRLRLTNEIPVRCTGYIEDGVFCLEAVWIDFHYDYGQSDTFDIIDSLAPAVIERLEEEVNQQIEEQLTP